MTADDVLGALLAYEVFMALSKRGPLLTTLCRRWRILAIPILGATALHLLRKELPCLP